MEADFSGYVTKAGLKCSDGRTITPEAFSHMGGSKVPLVWQHVHNAPSNVLGHVQLEARKDGVYGYGFFNDTDEGQRAKSLVQHGDITALSIYANKLVEKSKQVFHGVIREVSLVLSGANPGALIDSVRVAHAAYDYDDDQLVTEAPDEAVIYFGQPLEHGTLREDDMPVTEEETVGDIYDTLSDKQKAAVQLIVQHASTETEEDELVHEDETVRDIYDTFNEKQKTVVHYMIGMALEQAQGGSAEHSDDTEGALTHKEGTQMKHNVFEANAVPKGEKRTITHADMKSIAADAAKLGSLKDAVDAYALKHGIEDIEVMFPDAKALADRPEFNQRRTEWVAGVLNSTRHSPFSRVKSLTADITQEIARAKGYIKGNYKKTEWFGVTKRTTSPSTVYKKQQLDRDDILDITDFDVVAWLKTEMRMMLDEEVARAILIGDGRDVSDEDKIKDPIGASDGAGIRSIMNDHELYVTTVNVNVDDANSSYDEVVDAVLDAMEFYKGSGTPDFYTTIRVLNRFLKAKDGMGRRLYLNKADVAQALGVNNIVTVEPMNDEEDLIGIIVNLADYNIGTDKGGQVSLFDDFDIDYNQFKYLIETRLSGALVKIKSALVIKKVDAALELVAPAKPAFNSTTGVVTIPTVTGVVYKNADTDATLTAGAQTALAAGATMNVKAVPDTGKYIATTAEAYWSFTRAYAE